MLKPDNEKEATTEQEQIVEIERILDLPIEMVWKAWTDATTMKKWFGPSAYSCPYCVIELRVGGKTLTCMRSPEGKETWSTATYREIVPMKKLVYIDSFSDNKGNPVLPSYYELPGVWGEEMKVTVLLDDVNGKTKMELTHTGIPEEQHHDCIIGWNQCFDKMEVNLKE